LYCQGYVRRGRKVAHEIGKARLGTVVHQKTAAILTFTDVRPEDKNVLVNLSATIKVYPSDFRKIDCRQIIMTNL
jgi:hypothetical protein